MSLIISLGFAAPVFADDVSGLFNNEIRYKGSDQEIYLYLKSDNTFFGRQLFADSSKQLAGQWSVVGDQVCFVEASTGEENCRANLLGKGVGDFWTEADGAGGEFEVLVRSMK